MRTRVWMLIAIAATVCISSSYAARCQIIRNECTHCAGVGDIDITYFTSNPPVMESMPVDAGSNRVFNSAFLSEVPTTIRLRQSSTNGVGLQSIVCYGAKDIAGTNFGGIFWVDASSGSTCDIYFRRGGNLYLPYPVSTRCDISDVNA